MYRIGLPGVVVVMLLAPPMVAGCGAAEAGGADCEDRLEASLPAGWDGTHVFEGTADEVAFHCTYSVWIHGGEQVNVSAGECTGPVHLRIETRPWPEMGIDMDWAYAVFPGTPARIDWTLAEPHPSEPGLPRVTSGTLDPEYRGEDGCLLAEAEIR